MKPIKVILELDAATPRNQIIVDRLMDCHKKGTPFSAPEFENVDYTVKKFKENPKVNTFTAELSLSK